MLRFNSIGQNAKDNQLIKCILERNGLIAELRENAGFPGFLKLRTNIAKGQFV